jgi:hypothetical protein
MREVTFNPRTKEHVLELAELLEQAFFCGLTVDWGSVHLAGERKRLGHRIWFSQTVALVPYKKGFRRIKRDEIGPG